MSAVTYTLKLGALTAGRTLRSNPVFAIGAAVVFLLVLLALFGPWLAPYPEDAGNVLHADQTLQAPSREHWFGTDQYGRDVFSRVLIGARISLSTAVIVLLLSASIGVPLGIIAGFSGGVADGAIMRITDVFLAFPALLLSLALAAVLRPGLSSVIIALAVTWWPWYTRLARGQAATVAGSNFVEGCRALGVPYPRMIARHVLPNSLTPVIVQMSLDAGGVILTAAALSYLGLGAQEPSPEWGLMVSQGQAFFNTHYWLVTFPGLAILLTALGWNLLGDGLRDILDPKQVERL
jgi:peptide/nickel transport system permease protein